MKKCLLFISLIITFSCSSNFDEELMRRNINSVVQSELPEDIEIDLINRESAIGDITEEYLISMTDSSFTKFFKSIILNELLVEDSGIYSRLVRKDTELHYVKINSLDKTIYYIYIDD